MAFFGFMRVKEFTFPTKDGYDIGSDLSFSDISVDKRNSSHLLRVYIKSKTDPFCQGVSIYLGATGKSICPVADILPCLPGPTLHH